MIKETIEKYKKKLIIIFSIIIGLLIIVFVSKYITKLGVNLITEQAKMEWQYQNRELLDNIAKMQERIDLLDKEYENKKKKNEQLDKSERKKYEEVKKLKNNQLFANYFDNLYH